MVNKLLTCLLILSGYLCAENGWSEPVLLSTTENWGSHPVIVSDKNNKLYVFWEGLQKKILYRTSIDGGLSWTSIDSTSGNQQEKPMDSKVVCDSHNNLILFYQQPYNNGKYFFQTMVNEQWNSPQEFVNYIGSGNNVVIDNYDNVFSFWLRQGALQTYYKIIYANNDWSPEKAIKDYVLFDVGYNGEESLHLVGSNDISLASLTNKAHYLKYNISKDSVVKITDISNNLKPSQAFAIGINKAIENQIFTALNVGATGDTASTWYSKQEYNNWLQPIKLKMKTHFRGKQILVDSGDNPHLFDMSLHLDTLFHLSESSEGWTTEKLVYNIEGEDCWINGYKAIIDIDNIYLVYNWTATGQNSRIYFIKKKINVGIEENSQIIANKIELTNYPNPFNNNTLITFTLSQTSAIKIDIFNTKGELVKTIFNSNLKSGKHNYNFNATALNSGVYYCRLTVGSDVKTTKLLLLK